MKWKKNKIFHQCNKVSDQNIYQHNSCSGYLKCGNIFRQCKSIWQNSDRRPQIHIKALENLPFSLQNPELLLIKLHIYCSNQRHIRICWRSARQLLDPTLFNQHMSDIPLKVSHTITMFTDHTPILSQYKNAAESLKNYDLQSGVWSETIN